MASEELSKATKWTGTHRGVRYLVSLHGEGGSYRPQGTWCYYLLIFEPQIPPEHMDKFNLPGTVDAKGRVNYDYMQSWLAGLDWHGGITFYEKRGGLDGAPLMFKVGCDYAHYFDEGRHYNLGYVEAEAKQTIDELLKQVPLLVRCSWDGCWVSADKATEHGSGYINNDCIPARNAAFPKAEPIVLAS